MDRSYQARISRLLLLACFALPISAGCDRPEPAPEENAEVPTLHYEISKTDSSPKRHPEPIDTAPSNAAAVEADVATSSIAPSDVGKFVERAPVEQKIGQGSVANTDQQIDAHD